MRSMTTSSSPGCIWLGLMRMPAPSPESAAPTATRGFFRANSSATSSPVMFRAPGSQRMFRAGARLDIPAGSSTRLATVSISATAPEIRSRMPSHSCHSASWSRRNQASTAASIPRISSLPILLRAPGAVTGGRWPARPP